MRKVSLFLQGQTDAKFDCIDITSSLSNVVQRLMVTTVENADSDDNSSLSSAPQRLRVTSVENADSDVTSSLSNAI